jgi:hypothetical protein
MKMELMKMIGVIDLQDGCRELNKKDNSVGVVWFVGVSVIND